LGIFFQGGAGFAFEDVTTPAGDRGELSALFGTLKLAPGVAWRIDDTLSVGAAPWPSLFHRPPEGLL
jgi:hypothetical protein